MNKKFHTPYLKQIRVCLACLFLFCSHLGISQNSTANSFSLQIDFGINSQTNQNGYQPYLAEHEDNNSFIPQTYTIGEITVSIDAEWPSGTINTAKQMIDRGEINGNEFSDLLRDWIGTDGRSEKVPMTLTISGLPAGLYEWKSYHHDQNDQTGIFSATVNDAAGSIVYSGIDISNGNLPIETITVFETQLKSEGNDVTLSFKNDSYSDNSASFFLMNGFVLTETDTTILPDAVELISPLNGLKYATINPELKWKESSSANEYNIYLSTDNPPQFLETVENAELLVSSLTPNSTYYWCVEAVNSNGGVKSELRSFTTKDANSSEVPEEIEMNFSHERKFYDTGFNLEITSNYPDLNIIYTLDCSTPSVSNGIIYKDGIQIDSTTIIKAIAIIDGNQSSVYTHSYLFPDYIKKQSKNPPGFPDKWGGKRIIDGDYEMDPEIINHPDYESKIESALKSIPSLSLTMSIDDWFNYSSGLYIGYPDSEITHEKAVTAEFLFQDRENIAVDCGVQNQGGTSIVNWKTPKQSMRLLFKEIYGPTRLRYKLFPDSEIESINTLVVDGFLYGWTHPTDEKQWLTSLFFRDQLAADMHKDMGQLSFHGMYVHLFINGLYWGMYDLHERPDDAFLAEYVDGEREDYEILKHNKNNVVQGTNEFYLEMLEVARAGLGNEEGLKAIQKYLDLPAFIDYMALNFYLGNYDWAHQNWYVARNKTENGTFKYFVWDAEHVMRYSDVSYNNTLKDDSGGPTEIHKLLKSNKEYRMMFADAVYKHFFNEGALSIANFEKRFLHRKNEIEEAVILESARWGDYREEKSGTTFTLNDHWLPEVNKVLDSYIPYRRDIVIKQLRDSHNLLFPESMPPVFEVEEVGNSNKNVALNHSNLMNGEIYFTVDGSDPRQEGGGINGIKYTGIIKVNASTHIKARFYSKDDGSWSALADKTFLFEAVYGNNLVINEIMYHPEDGKAEFIEILNTGESFIDLQGFYFDKGIEYTFGKLNIQPGKGIVLSNDTVLFRNTYDFSAYGQYEKNLSNKGETILLKNNFDQLVDSLTYSNSTPWPEEADGDGYSLELINSQFDNALATSWQLSSEKNGTPFYPETQLELETVLYPNPFTDAITIAIRNQSLLYDRFEIEIYNQLGAKVKYVFVESYGSNIELDMSNVSQGMYFIHIKPTSQTEFKSTILKAVKM